MKLARKSRGKLRKGKLSERKGRKATNLRSEDYDGRAAENFLDSSPHRGARFFDIGSQITNQEKTLEMAINADKKYADERGKF